MVCFGSFDWAPLHTPALTTVEQDTEQYVKLTVETLLQRIANKEYANVPAYKNSLSDRYAANKAGGALLNLRYWQRPVRRKGRLP